VLAGSFVDGFTLDHEDLADVGEVDVGIERRTAPNAPRLNAAVIGRVDVDEVGATVVLEQRRDIALQRRLVTLGGEVIMGLSGDDIACQCPLGQQRVAGDVAAGDVTAFK
jgi:hypothetical protein